MLREHHNVTANDMDVFTVVDKPEDATRIIVEFRNAQGYSGLQLPPGMRKKNGHSLPKKSK
jgi:hypothetical protein